jgi:acetyltransferase-like isoleucine patch superfamily enzyme
VLKRVPVSAKKVYINSKHYSTMRKTLLNWLKSNDKLAHSLVRLKFWLRNNHVTDLGKNNVIINHNAALESNTIEIYGDNNTLLFEVGASVKHCTIKVYGNGHKLFIGKEVVLTQTLLWFEDSDCEISFGYGTTMQRFGHIAVTEPGRKIVIGSNCMFSFNVDIRNGDSHAIFDAATGKRINYAKDIIIHDSVWLGAYTQVLGGADIGAHSIVGIRSLVNKPIPEGVIVAGIPAKVVRENIKWSAQRKDHL